MRHDEVHCLHAVKDIEVHGMRHECGGSWQ